MSKTMETQTLESRKRVLLQQFDSERKKLDYQRMGGRNWQRALDELNVKYISLLIEIYRETPRRVIRSVSSHSYNGEGREDKVINLLEGDIPDYPYAKIVGYYTQTYGVMGGELYHPLPHITRVATKCGGVAVVEVEVDEYVPYGGILVEPIEIISLSYSVGDGGLNGSVNLKIPVEFSDRMRLKYPGAVEEVDNDPPLGDSWGHQWRRRVAHIDKEEVWSIREVIDCRGPGYSCSYSHGPFEHERGLQEKRGGVWGGEK